MINAIGSSNPIQMLNATNAFKATQAAAQEPNIPESEGILEDNSILQNQDLNEIKQFAKIAGEENISDEDIKYGITYGRSVIADYVA